MNKSPPSPPLSVLISVLKPYSMCLLMWVCMILFIKFFALLLFCFGACQRLWCPWWETGRWCSLGSPGAGARAHHRFGSLTLLVVAPSSSQEQGDPGGDKSGSLTTPEIASFVSISPSTFRCETKALTGVTFFFLCPCPFSLGLLPFRSFLQVTPQSGA